MMFKCKHSNLENIANDPYCKLCKNCKKVLHLEVKYIINNKYNGYVYEWVNYDWLFKDNSGPRMTVPMIRAKVVNIVTTIYKKIKSIAS